MKLDVNKQYDTKFIQTQLVEKQFSINDIKKFIPKFKGCSCKQPTCQNNSVSFYQFALNNLMEESNLPDSNFYYDPRQQPKELNFELITFD